MFRVGEHSNLMDQHALTRADMAQVLGTPSRVTEVLKGKKELSMAMVQRTRPIPCACRSSHSGAQTGSTPVEARRSLTLAPRLADHGARRERR
jgi:HTH-type transcriptional regulator/antitoxin HigA